MPLTPNVYLEFDIENKRARVIDNTNYADNDIVLSLQNAKGLGVVTGPTGTAVISATTIGNPLVNLAVSTNGQYFNLPLDSNGEVLNGTYAFTYSVRYAGFASINSITATSDAELQFYTAGVVLQDGDSIVFAGNTNPANNGTFTIDTVSYDEGLDTTYITVDQTTLVTASPAQGTFSYDVTRSGFASGTYTWNGCIKVTPIVTTTYDCESTQFGQIIFSDSSSLSGQQLVSRELVGYYPNALIPAPPTESVSTSTTSLTFNELAVGTWSHKLTLNMTYTQPDGLVVNYTVVDTGETKVTCAGTLCGLTPCIESIKDKYAVGYNTGKATGLEPVILMILQLYALAKEYKTCGEYEKYKSTVSQMEAILDKSGYCECGCCDESKDVPYWVDNANLDTPSAFEQLQEQVDLLTQNVGSLENLVQNNSAALLAYNALVSDMNTLLADVTALLVQENLIQSLIGQLNPNAPTFADDVDSIELLIADLETDYLALNPEVSALISDWISFNTTYPEYASYSTDAVTYLQSVLIALAPIQGNIDNLEALLASITPNTYAQDIAALQADIINIYAQLNLATGLVFNSLQSIQVLQSSIINLQNQINDILAQINAIVIPDPQVQTSKVQPLYSGVNVQSATVYIPAKYTKKGGYFKVYIKGQDATDPGFELYVTNNNTSFNLINETSITNKAYQLEFIVVPNLSSAPFVFDLGGSMFVSGVSASMQDVSQVGIAQSDIEYDTDMELKVNSNSLTNVFWSIEVYGYDLTFN